MVEKNVFEDIDEVPAGTYQNPKRNKAKQILRNLDAKRKSYVAKIKEKLKDANVSRWRNVTSDIPLPRIITKQQVRFRAAPNRVNVLSSYGNDKFYHNRKPRPTYLR